MRNTLLLSLIKYGHDMKTYQVISPFRLRDKKGNNLAGHAVVGQDVDLPKKEATRLIEAQCIIPVEDRRVRPPGNRKRNDINTSQ